MANSFGDKWRQWTGRGQGEAAEPGGPDVPESGAPEPGTPAGRAYLLHQSLLEAYQAGDVPGVLRLVDLFPEGPAGEPYATFARIIAAEAQADDARGAAIAKEFLDRTQIGGPAWDTARALYGEVAVQALVMGTLPLAGNLESAEQALSTGDEFYVHPSGALVKYEPSEDHHPLLHVLHGDPARGVKAARRNLKQERNTPAGHADALCVLALCLRAAGDVEGARAALAEAEILLPGRPRIAVTRARIESDPNATISLEKE